MAKGIVVKVWNVKAGSSTRSAAAQISDSIDYIENPEKGMSLPMLRMRSRQWQVFMWDAGIYLIFPMLQMK